MFGQNDASVEYDKACMHAKKTVTIKVKLGTPRPSSTDKMNIEYTSGGFQTITEDGLRMNLTIGRKANSP